MPWALDVRQRRRQPEIMDHPDLDRGCHIQALRGLERINRLSRSSAILWPAVRATAREVLGRPLELLDLATGAGDIPISLAHRAQQAGVALRLEACDVSATALDHARQRAQQRGADVEYFKWDALAGPLPRRYDIVVSSLFLHHLERDDAVTVLRHMAAAARHLVLVNDLRRSTVGWLLAWAGTRLLSRSPVAHRDGPVSVEGAFACKEAKELADAAGLGGATVRRRWPCRWLLTWRPGPGGRAA